MEHVSNPLIDEPKCLRDNAQCALRRERLDEPNMRELTAFVGAIRAESGESAVPDFDPLDGGIDAKCLFLLEAPGRRAIESGFVSRNNPDETAKNWWELNRAAGVERCRTLTWNIVPWYLGEHGKIRAARISDIRRGLPYLRGLIGLLPKLRLVVLVGRKAARAESSIRAWNSTLAIIAIPHPSPSFLNRAPHHRDVVLRGLMGVQAVLEQLATAAPFSA